MQAARIAVVTETVEWLYGNSLRECVVPYWPRELRHTRTRCNLGEDCRALPLTVGELGPGFPEAEDVARLNVLDYVESDLAQLLAYPRESLLPECEWPGTAPEASVNVECLENWRAIAALLVYRGLLTPIPAAKTFQGK